MIKQQNIQSPFNFSNKNKLTKYKTQITAPTIFNTEFKPNKNILKIINSNLKSLIKEKKFNKQLSKQIFKNNYLKFFFTKKKLKKIKKKSKKRKKSINI